MMTGSKQGWRVELLRPPYPSIWLSGARLYRLTLRDAGKQVSRSMSEGHSHRFGQHVVPVSLSRLPSGPEDVVRFGYGPWLISQFRDKPGWRKTPFSLEDRRYLCVGSVVSTIVPLGCHFSASMKFGQIYNGSHMVLAGTLDGFAHGGWLDWQRQLGQPKQLEDCVYVG